MNPTTTEYVTAEQIHSDFSISRLHELGSRRLRITYILGSLRDGGTERRTIELLNHLDPQQFETSLILMEDAGANRARQCAKQSFVVGIPEAGNSRWWKKSVSLTMAIWKTRVQLTRWRSHVAHAMLPGVSIIGGAAARLARVPVFVGSRPCLTRLYHSGHGVIALADKAAFRLANTNLANSVAAAQEMISVGGCPPAKCQTIYNGVDTQRFHPGLDRSWRAAMGWSDKNVVFGLVGNFRPYKRHMDFVEAANLIVREHPHTRFVMAGADFGCLSSVLARIGNLGLQKKFQVVTGEQYLEKIFAAFDVYVCASESESFSNAILEAMACGKAVIATKIGGNPEAVVDGLTGFIVPCGDAQSIAIAAGRLIEDPSLRHTMGFKARDRAEREFSLDRMVKMHEQLYLKLFLDWRTAAA
jgi:glycosyltransferase involved in cell wall biosynthesis